MVADLLGSEGGGGVEVVEHALSAIGRPALSYAPG
jgi:hypothetical protein